MSNQNSIEVIAIDGPAGSGKSTVAKRIAERLDWSYIDTGAMYRCLCLYALRHGLETEDVDKLIEGLRNMQLTINFTSGVFNVRMNGEDVTGEIRENRVSRRVSEYAEISEVRDELVALQRRMGQKGEAVVEGRDIGTVVFPDASYKFYLDAPLEVRARRRYNQLKESEQEGTAYESVLEEMRQRDRTDRDRSAGPLKPPDDSTIIDTADMSVEQVVSKITEALETNY